MQHWVVVAALEIIEAGFYVANVAAVGQGVPEGDGAAAGVVDDLVAIGIEDARDRAPRVMVYCAAVVPLELTSFTTSPCRFRT